jgi:predicted transcriptional regulator
MERTTLMLPDATRDRLRRIAAERGVSMATIIREAIDEKVASSRPRPRSIGSGASGTSDTAQRSATERPEPRSWR